MMNFNIIKMAVAKQFEKMQQCDRLYYIDGINGDELWDAYLKAFPIGANPIMKVRTEHDCSCCRHFIKNMGGIVAIIDGKIATLWDIDINDQEPAYQVVADTLSALIKTKPIGDIFLHGERSIGTDKNFQEIVNLDNNQKSVQTWTHFFVNIAQKFIAKKDNIPTIIGTKRASRDVFLRSVNEITDEAIETVLELIAQNSLYRGEEHKAAVVEFKKLKTEYLSLPTEAAKVDYSWGASCRIRNTVIGTLLDDLSKDEDLDKAVKSFESKVAPMNYKRPTALITQGMINKAKATISELGLTSALERRYATINDITVNNLLFVDRAHSINGDVFDSLPTKQSKQSFDKVEVIPIDKFVKEILPKVESIDVFFENNQIGNLVSLIAPIDATAGKLFRWDNNFSWAYNGDVADSIKERVKKAGGNVEGDLCCRLGWYNFDDLDLHMSAPGGDHIYYAQKTGIRRIGELDVDMNAGSGQTREAVENIFYRNRSKMFEGQYTLYVNQFRQRESIDYGFEVEIDYLGQIYKFGYNQILRDKSNITVAVFNYSHKGGLEILESLPMSTAKKTVWGIPTGEFHKVSAMMLSPNYWNQDNSNGTGNKHYFFVLENCKNDGNPRGFFNEYLRSDFEGHRKVFEIVGSKIKVEKSNNQLSGLGFSSTQKNTLVCRVKGSFSRIVKIQI